MIKMKAINCKDYTAIRASRQGYMLMNDENAPYEYYTAGKELYCSLHNVRYCFIGITADDILYVFRSDSPHNDLNGTGAISNMSEMGTLLAYNKYIPFNFKLEYATLDGYDDNYTYPDDRVFEFIRCEDIPCYGECSMKQPPNWNTVLPKEYIYWLLYKKLGKPKYGFRKEKPDCIHSLTWKMNTK